MTAALFLAMIELGALRRFVPDLVVVVLSLFALLGLVAGAGVFVCDMLVSGPRTPPAWRAGVRALAALPAFVFVGRHLFDGSHAHTLPGARLAKLWVPLLGYAGVAGATFLGQRILRVATLPRRLLVGGPVLAIGLLAEVANRRMFPTEYPDIHLFLVLFTLGALAVALMVLVRPSGAVVDPFQPGRVLLWVAVVALVALSTLYSLVAGLESRPSRFALATRGNHARQLVRAMRNLLDGDGDGFSSVLAGGDCNDSDPSVNPGAVEILGNDIDEDCDGVALAAQAMAQPVAIAASAVRAQLIEQNRSANLVFISVDALRFDAVQGDEHPNLAKLLADSTRFDRAFAPAAGTDLSLATVLTGRVNPFASIEQTIPEALHDSGRTTWAVLPSEALRYAGQTLLSRGFDHLDIVVNDREKKDVGSHTTSVETADHGIAALDQLGKGGRPFFLWLHFFDVHEHDQVEATDPRLAEFAGPDALRSRAGKYHALVALTDREIGRFLAALDQHGLADHTVIVFFTDHGESLGDDPRLPDNHGRFVYNPLVHVPLAFRIPAVEGTVLTEAVSLLDMPATVLELLGISPPAIDGWSLLPLITADVATLGPRALPLHESDQWGVVAWPWKLMVRPSDNLVELYDLEHDFDEHDDLAERDPDEVRTLKGLFAQFPAVHLDRSPAGREERERLARPPAR